MGQVHHQEGRRKGGQDSCIKTANGRAQPRSPGILSLTILDSGLLRNNEGAKCKKVD